MKAVLLVAVVADELEERAEAIIREEGGQGVTILPGRGLGFPEHKTFYGLTYVGLEKILLCPLDDITAERAAGRLNRELELLRPFQGLAFTLKLGATGGMSAYEIRRFIEAERPKTAQDTGVAD
ncbi:MAG TPA: hypothetical protein VLN90_08440 [Thioalkalivibrio sp.]|nr:hypothetical protein [Thioalkalivibrio sp.]